jgi:uncharacterized UPF0146 family protein
VEVLVVEQPVLDRGTHEAFNRSPTLKVPVLPAAILASLPPAPRVVEIGVGGRFDLLATMAKRFPTAHLVAVDVDPHALEGAPRDVHAHVDDVHDPHRALYRGADLLVARRPPVELQLAIARLARTHEAGLAMAALKDEWADLADELEPPQIPDDAGSWRWWPPRSVDR